MELRHLRYFLAVADRLSFVQAAKHLNISQPPLSRQIQQMESEIGTQVFDRSGIRICLTAAGAYYLAEARKIIESIDVMSRQARIIAASPGRIMVIGCVNFLLFSNLPSFLECLTQCLPDVRFDIRTMPSDAQQIALQDGSIDIALVRNPVNTHGFCYEPLGEESLAIIYPIAMQPTPRSISNFSTMPIVQIKRELAPNLFDMIGGICNEAGFQAVVSHQCEDAHSLIKLVAAGAGWAIVPSCALSDDMAGIGCLPITQHSRIGVCYRLGPNLEVISSLVAQVKVFFNASADPCPSAGPDWSLRC